MREERRKGGEGVERRDRREKEGRKDCDTIVIGTV